MKKLQKHSLMPKFTNEKSLFIGIIDSQKTYLELPTFDCSWYWGFGYLEVYNKPKTDIISHQHFDGIFKDYNKIFEMDSFLTDAEKWHLLDLFASFYTFSKTAAICHGGTSNYAKNDVDLTNLEMYYQINVVIIPMIFYEIIKILAPVDEFPELIETLKNEVSKIKVTK